MAFWKNISSYVFFSTVLALSTGYSLSAKAATFQFADFSDVSAWQLNGVTTTANSGGQQVLRLTNNLFQSGSAFLTNRISLENEASFSARFQFQITNPLGISDGVQGADGLVFVIQTLSNNVGEVGGGIGYQNISNSIGIEFDTWDNGFIDRNNGNHVGINLNGNINSLAFTPFSQILNNGTIYTAWVDYDGLSNNLEVRLSDSDIRPTNSLLSYTVDLVPILGTTEVFVGFTSATGAASNDHDIRNFTFINTFEPITVSVPEPSSILGVLSLGTIGINLVLKRKLKS